MKKQFLAISFVLGALVLPWQAFDVSVSGLAGAAETNQTDPARFHSGEGKFSIILPPGFPTFDRSQSPLSDDPKEAGKDNIMVEFMSVGQTGACAVFYNDISAGDGSMSSAILDAGQEGVLEKSDYWDLQKNDYSIGNHAARSLTFREKIEGMPTLTRVDIVWAPPRLYQVYYSNTRTESPVEPVLQNYFQSFRLE